MLLFVGACTFLTPYRLEIQQGHVMTDEAMGKLRAGMTKNQVSQVLGTPLLNDVFHANRWDYVHYVSRRGNMKDQKHVALLFEDEKLARLEGPGAAALAPLDPVPDALPPVNDVVPPPLEKDAPPSDAPPAQPSAPENK